MAPYLIVDGAERTIRFLRQAFDAVGRVAVRERAYPPAALIALCPGPGRGAWL